MHFSPCLLTVTYLSAGVSAFYPYGFAKEQMAGLNKADNGDKRRFYSWLPQGSDDFEEDYVPTLDIKKGPKVRSIPTRYWYGRQSTNR